MYLDLNGKESGGAKSESSTDVSLPSSFTTKKRPRKLSLSPEQKAIMLSSCKRSVRDYGLIERGWSTDHKYVGQQVLRYGFNEKTSQRWFTPAIIVAYFKPRRGQLGLRNQPNISRLQHTQSTEHVHYQITVFFQHMLSR